MFDSGGRLFEVGLRRFAYENALDAFDGLVSLKLTDAVI
jgi:hypothetical protein